MLFSLISSLGLLASISSLLVTSHGLLLETLAHTTLADMQRVARNDMAVIAKNEDQVDLHVQEFFRLAGKIERAFSKIPALPSDFAKKQAKKREKIQQGLAKMKQMNQDLETQFQKHSAFLKSGAVANVMAAATSGAGGKIAVADALGPALMIPMLEGMYAKFKGDIQRANKQENRAKARVLKQEKEYIEFQTAGKTYLLKDKQRVVDYYKTQREIQHRHFHAMLKMAHSMMERIKNVKGMCEKAKNGKKLSEKEMTELGSMAGATNA